MNDGALEGLVQLGNGLAQGDGYTAEQRFVARGSWRFRCLRRELIYCVKRRFVARGSWRFLCCRHELIYCIEQRVAVYVLHDHFERVARTLALVDEGLMRQSMT